MVILIVCDGLRPDMITRGHTPFLHQMSMQGVVCGASHAVFPTATRINSASLATGSYPWRHGIVDNELYIPAIDDSKAATCADWRVLQTMADIEHGPVLHAQTLGEVLRNAGKQMVSGGSGSPGTTYLTNPTATGPVVNWATAWPHKVREEIESRYGSFSDSDATSMQRSDFVMEVMQDYLIPKYNPDLLTVWLTEPDHTQHYHGLGSPENLATLSELDGQIERFLVALEGVGGGDRHTCFLLSDHGFNTISEQIDVAAALVSAGLKEALDSDDVIRASNSLYVAERVQDCLGDIIHFLQEQPWIGAVFVRDDLLEVCRGVMAQSAVYGFHRRSAEIMFAYRWRPQDNDYGLPGCAISDALLAATHGSTSPYDISNCLVAWGERVKTGVVSSVPCGIVDVAPTVLALLGIGPPATMEGRVLTEIFEDGPSPDSFSVSHETQACVCQGPTVTRRQVASYSVVCGYRYLNQVELVP